MIFNIQLSNPDVLHARELCDDFSDAAQACFPMLTDDAILSWNHILLGLNYKYDVSIIFEDVMQMFKYYENVIVNKSANEFKVRFGSNDFFVEFHHKIEIGLVTVFADWSSYHNPVAKCLLENPIICVEEATYWHAWGRLINFAFEKVAFAITPGSEDFRRIQWMNNILSAIPNGGGCEDEKGGE